MNNPVHGQFMGREAEIASLIKQGRSDRAEELCQAEILVHPSDPRTWYYLAAAQSMQGRHIEAIRSLKLAASHCEGTGAGAADAGVVEDQQLLLSTAQALLRLQAYAEALPLYQRLDPVLPQVILGQGQCHWGLGDYQQALSHFSRLRETWPQRVDLGLKHVRALCSLDRHREAGEILRESLQRSPHEAETIHQYALWLLSCRGQQQALQWLQGQQPDRPAKKLVLLRHALTNAGTAPLNKAFDGDTNWLNRRQRSQWLSYQTLRRMPGQPVWFGDNVALLKHAVKQMPGQGIVVECGVFHGRSLNLLAHWSKRECHGFDSFEGLPEAWTEYEPAGAYSTHGRAPRVAANVTLHRGWFDQTLPAFSASLDEKIALLHVDCDLYSSTASVLRHLLTCLAAGAMIVFDDMAGYPEWHEHEYRAWLECVEENRLNYELSGAVMLGRSAAFRLLPS